MGGAVSQLKNRDTRYEMPTKSIAAKRKKLLENAMNATIAEEFNIPIANLISLQISKRQYSVSDCGPEVVNNNVCDYYTVNVTDIDKLAMLVGLKWIVWLPPMSWRLKIDQVYDLEFFANTHRDMPTIGKAYSVKLRLGPKWVGPDIHSTYAYRRWLHRIDDGDTPCDFFQQVEEIFNALHALKGPKEEIVLEEIQEVPKDGNSTLVLSPIRQERHDRKIIIEILSSIAETICMEEEDTLEISDENEDDETTEEDKNDREAAANTESNPEGDESRNEVEAGGSTINASAPEIQKEDSEVSDFSDDE